MSELLSAVLKEFVGGNGFLGIFLSIVNMFNIPNYVSIFKNHPNATGGEIALAVFIMLLILAALIAIIWFLVIFIRKFFRRKSNNVLPQDLIDEIATLKRQLVKMSQEKDRLLGLKVGAVSGLGGDGSAEEAGDEGGEGADSKLKDGESRFYKLSDVDAYYLSEDYQPREYNSTYTLEQYCDMFRNYAANNPDRPWRKLYYEPKIVRLFFSSLATSRLLILQGISGTGKTSLPECLGHFLQNPATIASVQPSWRDRTELFGYFNEFTKRFNETEVLKKMYEATWNNDVYITVLDEMNIARVEYYFAEMLSILEMPSRDQWVIDLVPSGWPSDPKHVEKGRFKLPQNMWFVGTANNDDSTFAISDKVYDRGMPININSKAAAFDAPLTESCPIDYQYLESLFKKAQEEHKVSEENLKKFEDMDDYVIEHFRLAFGNRIVKQLREFVPVYVACGGTEIDGLDYVLANKILRKFESLNLGYIRDEIDAYIDYLNEHFGEENMSECKEYLNRLKKLF